MRRCLYFDGAASGEPATARPIRSAVRSQLAPGSPVQRRIEAGPLPAAGARSRSRCTAGHHRSSAIPARKVIPATMRNERMPNVIGFMATSDLDLGDPPDHEEADRLQDQAGAHEPGADRVGLEGIKVARVHELEDDREYRGAQPRADGRPA